MKRIFSILVLVLLLVGCSSIQISPDIEDTVIDFAVFNAGCIGIIEAPEIIKPAVVIAKKGLDLINKGKVNLGNIITDLKNVLDVGYDNKVLQANIKRMLNCFTISVSVKTDVKNIDQVKIMLQSFIDGTEKCQTN